MRSFRKLAEAVAATTETSFLVPKDIASRDTMCLTRLLSLKEKRRSDSCKSTATTLLPSRHSQDEVDSALQNLVDELQRRYDTKVAVFSSHTDDRFSFHLVVDKIFDNNRTNKKEATLFVRSTSNMLKVYIDLSLYKSNQLFRIVGSTKIDSNGVKVLVKGEPGVAGSLVCA